jgi:CheY-like chemotaxis protein
MSIVSTIDEAVDIAQEASFDIYLLDINLGERRTGVELLQLLRALNGQYVPALALTAYALPGDKERFLEAGFDGYLSKPFTRAMLIDTIDLVLKKNPV